MDPAAEMAALNVSRCTWCKGAGRKRRPCPLCGALILANGTIATQVAGLFADLATEPHKRKAKVR